MKPKFSELNKVRIVGKEFTDKFEGYVIAWQFRNGRWIYKISISEDPNAESFDNWVPEECLQLVSGK